MKTLEEDYELPFNSIPPESFEGNNASARSDMEFVRVEVKMLETSGCIKKEGGTQTQVCSSSFFCL